jgi:hypothetical protein
LVADIVQRRGSEAATLAPLKTFVPKVDAAARPRFDEHALDQK